MTTHSPNSEKGDLERKLDDIKNALHFETTTTTVLDKIENSLNDVHKRVKQLEESSKRNNKRNAYLAVAIMFWAAAVTAFLATPESESTSLRWFLFGFSMLLFVYCLFKGFKQNSNPEQKN